MLLLCKLRYLPMTLIIIIRYVSLLLVFKLIFLSHFQDKLRQTMTEKLKSYKIVGQSYGNLCGCYMGDVREICMKRTRMFQMTSPLKT